MLIDWFTVGAQMLNFIILVWLLKHFLYKPILNAIDMREKRIAADLASAESKKADAQKEHDEFDSKTKQLERQRSALLAKAADDAKAEHDHLLDDAHKAADGFRSAQAASLKNDQVRLSGEITRLAKDEVFAVARKALADLATVSLEERIGEVFTRRLREMDARGRGALGAALKDSPEPSLVRSAFDLPTEQKVAIQNALNETFSSEVRIHFETDANNVCGIELTANGQKLGWSIASYLTSFDGKIEALLNAQTAPVVPVAPGANPKSAQASEPAAQSQVQ